jgi:hypothetical protein
MGSIDSVQRTWWVNLRSPIPRRVLGSCLGLSPRHYFQGLDVTLNLCCNLVFGNF